MPSFTVELFRVLDQKPESFTEDAWLGLDDYPIFDEAYRVPLNTKIKNHFMFQEIGMETVDQFRFAFRRKMHEIMPLYNQLYESARIAVDPLLTMDIKTIATGLSEQNSTGTSENVSSSDIDAKAKNVLSNFPQVQLRGNADYASNGTDSNSQTKSTGEGTENSSATNNATNENESRTSGYQGSPGLLLMQARASFLNVDLQVIADIDSDMFMLVWNTADEYYQTKGRFLDQ
jgi:hypothetical protein